MLLSFASTAFHSFYILSLWQVFRVSCTSSILNSSDEQLKNKNQQTHTHTHFFSTRRMNPKQSCWKVEMVKTTSFLRGAEVQILGRYAEHFLFCSFLAWLLTATREAARDCNMISVRLLRAPLSIFIKVKLNTIPERPRNCSTVIPKDLWELFNPAEFNSNPRTPFFLQKKVT